MSEIEEISVVKMEPPPVVPVAFVAPTATAVAEEPTTSSTAAGSVVLETVESAAAGPSGSLASGPTGSEASEPVASSSSPGVVGTQALKRKFREIAVECMKETETHYLCNITDNSCDYKQERKKYDSGASIQFTLEIDK